MAASLVLFLLTAVTMVTTVLGANIMFFFYPMYSHYTGSLHVASELSARGHVVWNALPTSLADDSRLKAPGVNIFQYTSLGGIDIEKMFVDKMIHSYFNDGGVPFDEMKQISDLILRDEILYEKMEKLNLDLLILDNVPIARMLTMFAYKLGVPFVFMGAAFEPWTSRTPFIISATPYEIMPWSPVMDFKTRLINTMIISSYWVHDPFSYYDPVALYAPEKPRLSMEALTAKASLWLIEQEPLLSYSQATLPNVRLIGGLSSQKTRPLPSAYEKFMDGAQHGVVVVSFGSNVKKIPEEIRQRFVEAFAMTKYRYIFKTDKEDKTHSNVLMSDWIPQADLLAHPNTRLFITHSGRNGINEAFLRAVPMLSFPMFAEQHYNAEIIVHKGFGMKMDMRTFTSAELAGNINEIMQNSSYGKKIKRAAEIAKLRERIPKDEGVYWIEHVLQYGGEHLRSYIQDMPLYQYLCLDIMLVVLVVLHLCFYLVKKLLGVCLRILLRCFKSGKQKSD